MIDIFMYFFSLPRYEVISYNKYIFIAIELP